MLHIRTDLKYGLEKEGYVLGLIKTQWERDDVKNTKDLYTEFCGHDFEAPDGTSWELKSRRNRKTQYPTTILPLHKVRDVETKQYFVFHFTDKTCYIEYDKEQFKTFKKTIIHANRQTGSNNDGIHYEIPVSLLTDL
jgi:hypothetical protein